MARTHIDHDALQAALLKMQQLEREISNLGPLGYLALQSKMMHTHSKLGIFLEQALPPGEWRKGWERLSARSED